MVWWSSQIADACINRLKIHSIKGRFLWTIRPFQKPMKAKGSWRTSNIHFLFNHKDASISSNLLMRNITSNLSYKSQQQVSKVSSKQYTSQGGNTNNIFFIRIFVYILFLNKYVFLRNVFIIMFSSFQIGLQEGPPRGTRGSTEHLEEKM